MLAELHIRNLALIERQRVAFEPGLNVISGVTGSGKSLLLDALRFVIGTRGSQDLIRAGAAEVAVEALFHVDAPHERSRLRAVLGDLPGIEDGEVVLDRSLSRKGRSRAAINGRLVPVATLREVGEELVELSSQHDAQALQRAADQRELLDAFGGHDGVRAAYQAAWQGHRAALARLEAVLGGGTAAEDARRRAVEAELGLLEEVRPLAGEVEALERELRILENATSIRDTLTRAYHDLYEEDGAAHGRAGEHARALAGLAALLPEAGPLASEVDECAARLKDAAFACRSLADGVEVDEARRAEASSRLGELTRAARRLGVRAEALPDRLAALEAEARRLAGQAADAEALEAERARSWEAVLAAGATLRAARQAAAERLGERLGGELVTLGLVGAACGVEVRDEPPGPTGLDHVELLFRAGPGQELRPLRRTASGGEAARVMLALRTLLAGRGSVPTLVFDEIDQSVGGRLGAVIGAKLAALGERYQVICVTHLAQVASFANHHLTVSKVSGPEGTSVAVAVIDGPARVREIAAMLRGDALTANTLVEAEEMVLAAARGSRR